MSSKRVSQQAFLGVSALLFAASAAVTIAWCASTPAMDAMPMPGRWSMPMSGSSIAIGVVVLMAGLLQFTAWKARHLTTVERLAPGGERVARATGAVVVVTGLLLIAQAVGLV